MYIGLMDCFKKALVESIAKGFNILPETVEEYFTSLKLKIAKTPDPSLGDYGVALHFLFHKHGVKREEWERIAEKIMEYIREKGFFDKCFIEKIEFVNGYLNIYIDYNRLFKKLLEDISSKEFFETLKEIGKGSKVIVEHTSANPVHPLHIGSGRNAVIGNTYARLLRYLGFKVYEHFYVNDMGRQVAILVYGYSLLKKHGVKPDPGMKIDHWFGAIYALTNTLIEKQKLLRKTHDLEKEFGAYVEEIKPHVRELVEKHKLYTLLDLMITLERVSEELKLRHDTHMLLNILVNKLENTIKNMGDENDEIRKPLLDIKEKITRYKEEYIEAFKELKEYSEAEARLASQYPVLHSILAKEIIDPGQAEETINEYMRRYEAGDEEISKLFKEVSTSVLKGFEETLSRLGIVFDKYDWESGEPGRKYLGDVLKKIEESPYCIREDQALIVDLDKASEDHEFIKKLFEPDTPGKFTLRRSDGTTLYTARDVAYSIYKARDYGAEKIYNVIAVEQVREQKQVKATLYLTGYRDVVDKLVHFAYEMVNLKGMKMSSRRGQYYSLDELIRDYVDVIAHKYFANQLKLGNMKYEVETKELLSVFEKLGVACTRALLLSVEPGKVLVFDPHRIEEYDLGAWITYTSVRIQSILRKAYGFEPLDNTELLLDKLKEISGKLGGQKIKFEPEEKNILEKINEYHSILLKAYKELDPSKILEYTRDLCMYLNQLYEKHPILGERDIVKKNTRLALIISALLILKDLMNIMGFPIVKKL